MSKILQSYLVRIGVKGTLTSRTSGNVHGVSSTDPHQVRGVLENKEIFDTIIPSQHESTKLFFRDINHGHVPGFLVNPLKKKLIVHWSKVVKPYPFQRKAVVIFKIQPGAANGQWVVWGPVVWIPIGSTYERDCYLWAPRCESQTTSPNLDISGEIVTTSHDQKLPKDSFLEGKSPLFQEI